MDRTTQASVLGVPNERFFPLYGTEPLEVEFQVAEQRQRLTLGLAPDAPLPAVQFLAVSGGGENGAFGAGLLCGWWQQGTRPEFELVTAVGSPHAQAREIEPRVPASAEVPREIVAIRQ
jgi:hypothetical protein